MLPAAPGLEDEVAQLRAAARVVLVVGLDRTRLLQLIAAGRDGVIAPPCPALEQFGRLLAASDRDPPPEQLARLLELLADAIDPPAP
jgi:hypothetical protein